jgi:hypothetical protein
MGERLQVAGVAAAAAIAAGLLAVFLSRFPEDPRSASTVQDPVEQAAPVPADRDARRWSERIEPARVTLGAALEGAREGRGQATTPDAYAALDRFAPRLQAPLRPAEYDRLVYESGRDHRVVVSALAETGAERGVAVGDVLRAIDRQRVFTPVELRLGLSAASSETTAVLVERDGQEISLSLPRRPLESLGVSLSATRVPPPAADATSGASPAAPTAAGAEPVGPDGPGAGPVGPAPVDAE